MTASSPDVDLDRLADFVGGALDGTPEADAVRTLVETDARWAEAHAALLAADAAVRSDLSALASLSAAPPMPDDVAARLERAFAVERTFPTARAFPTERGGSLQASRPDSLRVDPSRPGHHPSPGHPGSRRGRRGRRRFTVALAAVAALVVLGVASVTALQVTRDGGLPGSSQMDSQAEAPAQATGGSAEAPIIVTGNDYSTGTLGRSADDVPPLGAQDKNSLGEGLDAPPSDGSATKRIPDELARLGDEAALRACLSAIRETYGGRVIRVEFARFQGRPAVIVFVDGARQANGRRFVVVVGPSCGAGGGIADERYHAVL